MAKIEIQDFEVYSQKLNKILDKLDTFCESLENENNKGESDEIEEIISKIKRIKTSVSKEGKATKEKTVAYLYQHAIRFIKADKINGEFPISNKFFSNMIAISKNKKTIHHSHATGKIIGFAYDFCYQKCKENYYTIPVFAHNQFRFDFFLFLKGIRPSVWETSDISISGKNPTNINFAIKRNQVKFIETIKYFQQSLGNLVDSMTDGEKQNVRKTCRNFIANKLNKMKSGF